MNQSHYKYKNHPNYNTPYNNNQYDRQAGDSLSIDDDSNNNHSTHSRYSHHTSHTNSVCTSNTQYNKQLIKQRFINNAVMDTKNRSFSISSTNQVTFESTKSFTEYSNTSQRLYILNCQVINASINTLLAKQLLSSNKHQPWTVHGNNKQYLSIRLHHPSLLGMIQYDNRSCKSITIYGSLYKTHQNQHTLYTNNNIPNNKCTYIQCGYMPLQYIRIVIHSGNPISINSLQLIGIQLHSSMFDSNEMMHMLTVINPLYHHMLFGDQSLRRHIC